MLAFGYNRGYFLSIQYQGQRIGNRAFGNNAHFFTSKLKIEFAFRNHCKRIAAPITHNLLIDDQSTASSGKKTQRDSY